MGLDEDIGRPLRSQAEALGCQDQLREDLLRAAFSLDLPVHNLDQDAVEDRPVEHLAQTRIGLCIGLAGLAQQRQRILKGLHDVVDLSDGLILPALDLGLLLGDALLFSLHDFDGDGVAVVQLNELLLLGRQLTQASAVTFGLLLGVLGLGTDELPQCQP